MIVVSFLSAMNSKRNWINVQLCMRT
jgi:hypothetical protein